MLTPEKKQKRVEICEELLKSYREEGDQFLLNIITGDESWIHDFDPEEKQLSMQYRHTSSLRMCSSWANGRENLCSFFP
jgi:hypothetical protein